MGTSRFKSNVVGWDGSQTIRGFTTISATSLTGGTVTSTGVVNANTSASTPIAKVSNYIKLSSSPPAYLFFGPQTTQASVEAAATVTVTGSIRGSLYLSTGGGLWSFTADDTATKMGTV
jgi:hypothetical protein